MDEQQIRQMLSLIIERIDYDIWKQAYNEPTAECPEDVEYNYRELITIVRQAIGDPQGDTQSNTVEE